MTEQPLDLRRSLRALRRRWWVIVGLAVVGIAGGVLFTTLKGPTFEARAGVLLPPSAVDANGRSLRNMLTESRIATSGAVLDRAGQTLKPHVSSSRLANRVTASAVGSDILEIRAQGDSARAAAALADAVANEYVTFSNGTTTEDANSSVALLQNQAAELQNQIDKLDADIAADTVRLAALAKDSPEAAQQSVLIGSQRAAQVDAARQLSSLNTRISDARLEAELSRRGLRVFEPANVPSQASRRQAIKRLGIGGALGLLAGVILAIYMAQGDHRLRSRDEVALAIAAPILASLPVDRPKRVDHWRALLERWKPSASERLAFRQILIKIGRQYDQAATVVAVVTLPGDVAAMALAVELAACSAELGIRTDFVIASRRNIASSLLSACAVSSRGGTEARPNLQILPTNGIGAADAVAADLVVTVVVPGGDESALATGGRGTPTVVAVSSGFATSDALASAVLACTQGGQRVVGVLLANPDPDDHTSGSLGLPGRRTAEVPLSANGEQAASSTDDAVASASLESRG